MKILFITRNEILPTTGGVERVTSIISDALKSRGAEIHIIYTGIKSITSSKIHEDFSYSFLPHNEHIPDIENREYICNYIANKKIDIIINQNANYSIAEHLNAQSLNDTKIITCFHTPPITPSLLFEYQSVSSFRSGLANKIKSALKFLQRAKIGDNYFREYSKQISFMINSSDVSVFPSRYHIIEYTNIFPLEPSSNMISINNPVSFPKQDIEGLLYSKRKIVLAVSRMERASKRIDLLLRAWSKIHQKHADWKLVIVGGPKSLTLNDPEFREMDNLKKLAERLKIKNVEFVGRRNPVKNYEVSPIYVMTSASEAWGMTLVEAQQFGCAPVVFQSFSALREIISPDENGICIPFGDIDGFAKAISRLIDDPTLREKIARSAEESTSRYSQEKVAKDWIDLFESFENASQRNTNDHS